MSTNTQTERMTEAEFNQAVATELRLRGRDDVAHMSEELDSGMSGLPSADVAKHSDMELTDENVKLVAKLRVEWYQEHY